MVLQRLALPGSHTVTLIKGKLADEPLMLMLVLKADPEGAETTAMLGLV